MSVNASSSDQPRAAEPSKKAYEKPSFRFEEVFVTSALSCGKIVGGNEGSCGNNTKVS